MDRLSLRLPSLRPPRLAVLALLLCAFPSAASEIGPEEALNRFRAARDRSLALAEGVALSVESEILYTLRFSERPGHSEFSTRRLDLDQIAVTPRPPVWQPEARVYRGEYLWAGEVGGFGLPGPRPLTDGGAWRLTAVEEAEARGGTALRLVFEGNGGSTGRVEVTVERQSFTPLVVEHTVGAATETPAEVTGPRLLEYRQRLSIASIAGLWLVAQGEESYRFAATEGERQVTSAWKSLAWQGRPAPPPPRLAEVAATAK